MIAQNHSQFLTTEAVRFAVVCTMEEGYCPHYGPRMLCRDSSGEVIYFEDFESAARDAMIRQDEDLIGASFTVEAR